MRNKKYCIGCDSHFYNGNNQLGIKECWHLKTAKLTTKYMIGWWVPQNSKGNFSKIRTYNCHTETGNFAFYDKLPEHLG
jgi:hypothetical protein